MVSKFYYFSLTVMKLTVEKNQTPKSKYIRPEKVFFDVIFIDFTSKSLFLGSNWAIIQFT